MKILHSFILLTSISLTACQLQTDSPRQVTEQYWQALKNGNSAAARQLVSSSSQPEFDQEEALPADNKLPLDDISLGTEQMTVTTIITHNGQHIAFDTVLVQQDCEWKIDASRTHIPAIKTPEAPAEEQIPDALQENLDSMSESLEEGAELLNELMQEGSKEMSESLRKGMDKMNEALREAMEKMKQRREQQESEPAPEQQNNNGEGLL